MRRLAGRGRMLPSGGSLPGVLKNAYEAGLGDAASELAADPGLRAEADAEKLKLRMNACWSRRCAGAGFGGGKALGAGRSYAAGFADGLRIPRQPWQPVPLRGTASAVVAASGPGINPDSLRELLRLPLREVIVVLDETQHYAAARSVPGVTVAHKTNADRGGARSAGARIAQGDIVLFADPRRVVPAERLALLLAAADGGADAAVADATERLGVFRRWDRPSRVAAFMNLSLGRPELQASTVANLPHAWSAKALRTIGTETLGSPPLAQRTAIERGLTIAVCRGVDGYPASGRAAAPDGPDEEEERLAVSEHMKALKASFELHGSRLALPDLARKRQAAARGGASR